MSKPMPDQPTSPSAAAVPWDADSPPCGSCGGPHPFDTTVPSVLWNRVIRGAGLRDYLCATCVLAAFVRAGESFTAEMTGDGFHRVPIEVRVRSAVATSAAEVSAENTRLRAALNNARGCLSAVSYMDVAESQRRDMAIDGLASVQVALDAVTVPVLNATAAPASAESFWQVFHRAWGMDRGQDKLRSHDYNKSAWMYVQARLEQAGIEAPASAGCSGCAALQAERDSARWEKAQLEYYKSAVQRFLLHPHEVFAYDPDSDAYMAAENGDFADHGCVRTISGCLRDDQLAAENQSLRQQLATLRRELLQLATWIDEKETQATNIPPKLRALAARLAATAPGESAPRVLTAEECAAMVDDLADRMMNMHYTEHVPVARNLAAAMREPPR